MRVEIRRVIYNLIKFYKAEIRGCLIIFISEAVLNLNCNCSDWKARTCVQFHAILTEPVYFVALYEYKHSMQTLLPVS
jgi:hypothetical protein